MVWQTVTQDVRLTDRVSAKVHFYHALEQQVHQQWYVHDQEPVFHFSPAEE